jgi:hypothetical protein
VGTVETRVTASSGSFNSSSPGWAGAGTYHFKARLRNSASGNVSLYSPVSKALVVS